MKEHGKIKNCCCGGLVYFAFGFLREIVMTIFSQKNWSVTGDRSGLTRSAMFLFIFIIIHAVGNLHVFAGAKDFNGYGYFYVRLYGTGFGFPANIVEEYVLLAALLHVFVAIKRTCDISVNYTVSSGKLNLAMSGVTLLVFMCIHLFQFRFGATNPFTICPPPYLVNIATVLQLSLHLFYMDSCKPEQTVAVRDIYQLEFNIFQSFSWCIFYMGAVIIFSTHTCLGWQKVVPAPALAIPKRYHTKATHVGYLMTCFVALIYLSFPIFAYLCPLEKGYPGTQDQVNGK